MLSFTVRRFISDRPEWAGLVESPAALASARADFGEWLGDNGVDPDTQRSAVLAAHEALSNGLLHSGASATTVSAAVDGRVILVEVKDRGHWREPLPDDEHGRGLQLIEGLSEAFELATGTEGTTLRFRVPF